LRNFFPANISKRKAAQNAALNLFGLTEIGLDDLIAGCVGKHILAFLKIAKEIAVRAGEIFRS